MSWSALCDHSLWTVAVGVFAVNVPFGYWRAGTQKFSTSWFLAVPVPIVIGLRLRTGLGWRLVTSPIFVVAFFDGQWLGGALRGFRASRSAG